MNVDPMVICLVHVHHADHHIRIGRFKFMDDNSPTLIKLGQANSIACLASRPHTFEGIFHYSLLRTNVKSSHFLPCKWQLALSFF